MSGKPGGSDPRRRRELVATIALLVSTLLWGTTWLPLRRIRESDPGGGIATVFGLALPLLVLLPFAMTRLHQTMSGVRQLGGVGLLLALGIALYAEGLVRGQVARVILLFYLMPVWSTLLGRVAYGVPITRNRVGAIASGLAGLAVICGFGFPTPFEWSHADTMALCGGFAWAWAAIAVSRAGEGPLFDRVFVQALFLAPLFYAVSIPAGADGGSLGGGLAGSRMAWAAALGLVWMLPAMALTVHGASHLDPGRVGVFLMLEVVIGVASAAWFAGEAFGWREIAGTALVAAAAGFEMRSPPVPGERVGSPKGSSIPSSR